MDPFVRRALVRRAQKAPARKRRCDSNVTAFFAGRTLNAHAKKASEFGRSEVEWERQAIERARTPERRPEREGRGEEFK